jgi:hypothetical protein
MPEPTKRLNMTNKCINTKVGSINQLIPRIVLAAAALAWLSVAQAQDDAPPTLPSPTCDSLRVTNGDSVVFHGYAIGVQIYTWTGTNWLFVAPAARLYADPGLHALVAIHYAGPTWETKSGSKVVGRRVAGCTPDSTAIPWLKLAAVSSSGPGVLNGVTFIQRVNTVGGIAPSTPGTTIGQEADVPYAAEYFFYSSDDTEE